MSEFISETHVWQSLDGLSNSCEEQTGLPLEIHTD